MEEHLEPGSFRTGPVEHGAGKEPQVRERLLNLVEAEVGEEEKKKKNQREINPWPAAATQGPEPGATPRLPKLPSAQKRRKISVEAGGRYDPSRRANNLRRDQLSAHGQDGGERRAEGLDLRAAPRKTGRGASRSSGTWLPEPAERLDLNSGVAPLRAEAAPRGHR